MAGLWDLPEKMLLRVHPAPLPKNYHFELSFPTGWQPPARDQTMLVLGDNTVWYIGPLDPHPQLTRQEEATADGFNFVLREILKCANARNLWGGNVPCIAVGCERQSSGALKYVARSNVVQLQLPVTPSRRTTNQWLHQSLATPPVPACLLLGRGGHLYYRAHPSTVVGLGQLPWAWHIDSNNRLEERQPLRGFDCFTFWLAFFAIAPKHAKNVVNGEILAQRLNTILPHGVPGSATVAELAVADLDAGVLWTADRFVVMMSQPGLNGILEYDMTGWHQQNRTAWFAAQNQASVWSYRKMMAWPLASYGVAGL